MGDGRVAATASVIVLLIGLSSVMAEDTVLLIPREESDAPGRRKGTILDYTGTALTLQLSGGREEQIPSARVCGYETARSPDHETGDQLFAEGRYADAVVSYRRAVESEPRKWVRRVLMAQLTRCFRNLQQVDRAGEMFLLIVQSDPATLWLDAIPLAWKPQHPSPELAERAERWIEQTDSPTARLMGASWLLTTTKRDQALSTLAGLTTHNDPRIALLAEAQRWRADQLTASLDQALRWEQQVQRLDESLQAGPWFVVGQALARHNRTDQAALALMRTAILSGADADLVGEAMYAAGEQLQRMGDSDGARTVYRELVEKHPKHSLVSQAQERLQQLRVSTAAAGE